MLQPRRLLDLLLVSIGCSYGEAAMDEEEEAVSQAI
jgi:hypothetical protein